MEKYVNYITTNSECTAMKIYIISLILNVRQVPEKLITNFALTDFNFNRQAVIVLD